MPPSDEALMKKAIQVRDALVKRYLHLPGVSVIEIGYSTENSETDRAPVVRIHVKNETILKTLEFPKMIEGIPIQVMVSDYKLE